MIGAAATFVSFFIGSTKSAELAGRAAMAYASWRMWKQEKKVEEQNRNFDLGVNPSRDQFYRERRKREHEEELDALRKMGIEVSNDLKKSYEEEIEYVELTEEMVNGRAELIGAYILTRTELLRFADSIMEPEREGVNEMAWICEVSARRLRDEWYRSLVGLEPLSKS